MNEQPYEPDLPADSEAAAQDDHEMPTRRIQVPDPDNLPTRRITLPEDYEMPTRRVILPDDETLASDATPHGTMQPVPPLLPRPEDLRPRTYADPLRPTAGTPLPAVPPSAQESAARRRRRGKTARERRDSGLYLPWWTLPILLAVVAFFVTLLLLGLNIFGGQSAPGGETPVVVVITSVPTARASTQPTLRPSPTPFAPGAALPIAPDGDGIAAPGTAQVTPPTLSPQGLGGIPAEPASATPAPGQIGIGSAVQVANVEGLPLNIREAPGRAATPRFLATEGSRFQVIGGPEDADGLIWWQVQDPQDPNRQGWAAQDYLAVVSE